MDKITSKDHILVTVFLCLRGREVVLILNIY